MKTQPNFDTAEAAWDSESRLSPFCTVYSPEQDNDEEWDSYYKTGILLGMDDLDATSYADSRMQ